jgi:hypothetical protein
MITVKQVYSRAFGEVPEGASCHIGWGYKLPAPSLVVWVMLTPRIDLIVDRKKVLHFVHCGKGWHPTDSDHYKPTGPDISDRDAEAFKDFFENPEQREAYNKALEELKQLWTAETHK